MGCRMIELDVHLLDGELVVIHDETLERTTNGEGRLSDYSLAELRELDAGQGEKIPLLREVFELCAGKNVVINVELKGKRTALAMVRFLENWPMQEVIVSSFDWRQLRRCHELNQGLRIGVLLHDAFLLDEAFQLCRDLKAEWLNVWLGVAHDSSCSRLVSEAHAMGVKVAVFTVRDAEECEPILRAGCDGCFADDPEAVMAWLSCCEKEVK